MAKTRTSGSSDMNMSPSAAGAAAWAWAVEMSMGSSVALAGASGADYSRAPPHCNRPPPQGVRDRGRPELPPPNRLAQVHVLLVGQHAGRTACRPPEHR